MSISANEQSSVFVTAVFTDEDGASVVPNSVTWTLTDVGGTVVNSREDVSVSAAASVKILLEGDDLPWFGVKRTDTYTLKVLFEALYDSGVETDIPLKEEETILVSNLSAIS